MIGAPYIDDYKLALEANRLGLPGVRFVPIQFTPNASVFANQRCQGVNLVVTDRNRLRSVATGVALATLLQQLYPTKFGVDKFDRLLVHPKTMHQIRNGTAWAEIEKAGHQNIGSFSRGELNICCIRASKLARLISCLQLTSNS